jgi:protein-disulfide isomerase
MAKKSATRSKRQLIREQRIKKTQRQRLITILAVVGVALIVAAVLIGPSLRSSLAPVGEIFEIEPHERPFVDGRAMGLADAPVLVEVWEDFQCPACKDYTEAVEPLISETYVANGDVRYVFRQFPFLDGQSATKESQKSANASMCASEQERFWDYHDMLFANWDGENRGSFSDKRLTAFAETIGLDMEAFDKCFDDNTYKAEIDVDKNDGIQLGVTGTPSVFVNGQAITPGFVPSFQEVSAAIDAELAALQ